MSSFAGSILKPISTLEIEFHEFINNINGVENVRKISGTEWYSFLLKTKEPINIDDIPSNNGFFEYPFVCRWGGESLIFASSSKDSATFFIEKLIPLTGLSFRQQGIDVNGFVRKTKNEPNRFTITYISARVSSWGAALRSVSFFGEDITSSGILRENLDKFSVTSCGVGEAIYSREALRLGTRGSINFSVSASNNYNSIDNILKYIKYYKFYLRD
jgi:hypothetical protein